ncbi:MAG: hypothetical protein ACREKS_09960 [Candidatus Rokuibacteriota bacterium]
MHEIVTSLVARDIDHVATGLGQLRHEHPAHPDLPSLSLLADALRTPSLSAPTHASLTTRVDELERCVAPAAHRFLGAEAAAFLRPSWMTLAMTAGTVPFDGIDPRTHPGWLCQQYGDWAAVRAAVEAEADWAKAPRLRYWMGLARHHLGEPETAVRLWIPLCWIDPSLFARHAPTLPSAPVRDAWEAFERVVSFGEVAADTTSTAAWFPAWLVVRHRGLVNLFRAEEIPDAGAPTRAFRVLLSLLPLERGGLSDEVVSQRRALRDISPGFFRHYLEVVSRRRRTADVIYSRG